MDHRSFLIATIVGWLAMLPALAPAASITGLGHLPLRSPVSMPNAISADGSVVVGISFSEDPRFRRFEAFRWEESTGMVGLGVPDVTNGTIPFSEAYAVSADGSLIAGINGAHTPVRWRVTNGAIARENVPGLVNGEVPRALSADGTIVVGNGFHLDTTTGVRRTLVVGLTAVSADGLIAVGISQSDEGYQAIRWDDSNGVLALSPAVSGASAVSADGSIVVGGMNGRAFRWDVEQGLTMLGDVSSADTGNSATGISGNGSIVIGGYTTAPGIEHALIWDAQQGVRSLESVLADSGTDLTGWTRLERATGISADGTRIVGYGLNAAGDREAWIAVIPEPGTAVLIGLGLAVRSAIRVPSRRWPAYSRLR